MKHTRDNVALTELDVAAVEEVSPEELASEELAVAETSFSTPPVTVTVA